jgi:probable F420-dependent oxidoreductase
MKIGVLYPQFEYSNDPTAIRDYAQAAEDLGYSHISAYEHILGVNPERPGGWDRPFTYQTPFFEPFILFSFMAGTTQKIGYLTRILILPQRQTTLVAKQAACLDVLCHGQLRLGIGLGWNPAEYIAQGEDFNNRAKRMDEQILVLRKLWKQPLVDFEGKWHKIPDGGINPLPTQGRIPIWIGGHSDATLRRVARAGDGWLPNDLPFDETKAMIERLNQYVAEAGRTRKEVGIDVRVDYQAGSPDLWEGQIEQWRLAGATHLTLDTTGQGFQTPEEHLRALRNFAEKVGLSTMDIDMAN